MSKKTAFIIAVCSTFPTLWLGLVGLQVAIDRALDEFYKRNLYGWDD